jgi:hypothetical protein
MANNLRTFEDVERFINHGGNVVDLIDDDYDFDEEDKYVDEYGDYVKEED